MAGSAPLQWRSDMHDWTFLGVSIDWKGATARLEFNSSSGPKAVTAAGLMDLRVPRSLPWGPSVSVNGYDGPTKLHDGGYSLAIEMQSGDTIELRAEQIQMSEA